MLHRREVFRRLLYVAAKETPHFFACIDIFLKPAVRGINYFIEPHIIVRARIREFIFYDMAVKGSVGHGNGVGGDGGALVGIDNSAYSEWHRNILTPTVFILHIAGPA